MVRLYLMTRLYCFNLHFVTSYTEKKQENTKNYDKFHGFVGILGVSDLICSLSYRKLPNSGPGFLFFQRVCKARNSKFKNIFLVIAMFEASFFNSCGLYSLRSVVKTCFVHNLL